MRPESSGMETEGERERERLTRDKHLLSSVTLGFQPGTVLDQQGLKLKNFAEVFYMR